MKKFLSILFSMTLIVVMGFTVGCKDIPFTSYSLSIRDGVEGLTLSREDNGYVLKSSSLELNELVENEGIVLIARVTNSEYKSFVISIEGTTCGTSDGRYAEFLYKGTTINIYVECNIVDEEDNEVLKSSTFTLKFEKFQAEPTPQEPSQQPEQEVEAQN